MAAPEMKKAKMEKPCKISELRTPAFLVDLDCLKNNCERMIERCKKLGVTLRPHMKTHKTSEAGKLMTGGTCSGIVVSTLAEAEFFYKHGFDDINYAYPITKDKLSQAEDLLTKMNKFHIMVDNMTTVDFLCEYPLCSVDKKWSVFLEMDLGYGRTGVDYKKEEDYLSIAKKLSSHSNVAFAGIYTHCGDSYASKNSDQIEKLSKSSCSKLTQVATRLREEGIKCPEVAIGSTPACSKPANDLSSVTEFHPGNYAFYDIQQMTVGACEMSDIAVSVLTRVIAHNFCTGNILIDCGFTALSHDGYGISLPTGYGVFDGHPNLKLVSMCQEIGKVGSVDGTPLNMEEFPIGSFLKVFPWHSCATACMHSVYYVVRGEEVIDQWKPCRGW